MDKGSALYQLMDIRVNDTLDEIVRNDEEYQHISKKSGEYLEKLDAMALPSEIRTLIDRHANGRCHTSCRDDTSWRSCP